VYLSSPMRRILRMEKSTLVNLYNSPIRFEDTAQKSVKKVVASHDRVDAD
jgi:hypothetical protein